VKLLKKYKKWTGSDELKKRFDTHIATLPFSFTRENLKEQKSLASNIQRSVQLLIPRDANGAPLYPDALTGGDSSPSAGSTTDGPPESILTSERFDSTPTLVTDSAASSVRPKKKSKKHKLVKRSAANEPVQISENTRYWNEYDDGDEALDNSPYMINVEPQNDSQFFKKASSTYHFFINIFRPSPPGSPTDEETAALLSTRDWQRTPPPGVNRFRYGTTSSHRRQESEDNPYLHKWLTPHYVTQIVLSYTASILFLLVALVLISTGRKKFKFPVDIFTLIGVVASLFFLIFGGLYSCRLKKRLSMVLSGLLFILVCVGNGAVLAILVTNIENTP
jgi:hypothetical protein